MFVVIERFKELADDGHIYEVGDIFPRVEYAPTYERVRALASAENKVKRPVIVEIADLDDSQGSEAPAEIPAVAPAEPPTETPFETPTEPPAEAPAKAPTEPPAEAPTETPNELSEQKEEKPKRGAAGK